MGPMIQMDSAAPPRRDAPPEAHRRSPGESPQKHRARDSSTSTFRLPAILQYPGATESADLTSQSNGHLLTDRGLPDQQALARMQSQISSVTTGLQVQQRDLQRVDAAVSRLSHEFARVFDAVRELQQTRAGPGVSPRQPHSDDSALEIMAQRMTQMASKVNEVDGLKVEVELLKRKLHRLEEAGLPRDTSTYGASRPGLPTQSAESKLPPTSHYPLRPAVDPRSQPAGQHHPGAPPHEYTRPMEVESQPRGWATVNSTAKRPPPTSALDDQEISRGQAVGSPKRPKLAPLEPRLFGATPEGGANVRPGSDSGDRRRISSSEWEQDNWASSQVSPDVWYSYSTPGRPGQVGIARRDSRGSVIPVGRPVDSYAHTKKTRTKPVRNAAGILIRKDGQPDMRSQSSAANLRKVHARKEQSRQGEDPSTPTGDMASEERMMNTSSQSPDNSNGSEQDFRERHEHAGRQDSARGLDYYERKAFEENCATNEGSSPSGTQGASPTKAAEAASEPLVQARLSQAPIKKEAQETEAFAVEREKSVTAAVEASPVAAVVAATAASELESTAA